MPVNRVLEAIKEGRPSFGIYVGTPSTRLVEMLGFTGLDFIRISMGEYPVDIEAAADIIRTAHSVVSRRSLKLHQTMSNKLRWPWVRARWALSSRAVADRKTWRPPCARRNRRPWASGMRPPAVSRAVMGRSSYSDHLQWTNDNIILAFQVETKRGVSPIEEILQVPGLDIDPRRPWRPVVSVRCAGPAVSPAGDGRRAQGHRSGIARGEDYDRTTVPVARPQQILSGHSRLDQAGRAVHRARL